MELINQIFQIKTLTYLFLQEPLEGSLYLSNQVLARLMLLVEKHFQTEYEHQFLTLFPVNISHVAYHSLLLAEQV